MKDRTTSTPEQTRSQETAGSGTPWSFYALMGLLGVAFLLFIALLFIAI